LPQSLFPPWHGVGPIRAIVLLNLGGTGQSFIPFHIAPHAHIGSSGTKDEQKGYSEVGAEFHVSARYTEHVTARKTQGNAPENYQQVIQFPLRGLASGNRNDR
jgi:hypothetical protein